MGLCKSTNCSVCFWSPRFVCFVCVPCILCFLDFEKCKFLCFSKFQSLGWHLLEMCCININSALLWYFIVFEYCSNKVRSALCWMGLCKSTNCSVCFWFPRSVVLYVPCILCFFDFEKCKFLCFLKESKSWLTSPAKCVVKISIQHYCATLLFEYCSNKVQSVLCSVGLCKSTDCSVCFWFPCSVVLYVPCILCFFGFWEM